MKSPTILTRRGFLNTAASTVAGLSLSANTLTAAAAQFQTASARKKRPNFIFVHGESWNGRCLSLLNEPGLKRATPNVEKIASQGTMFDNAYCTNPVCCPSRASMRSGLYTHKCKGWNNHKGLSPNDTTFADYLKKAGYLFGNEKGGFGKIDYLSGSHSQLARLTAWTAPAQIELPAFRMAKPTLFEIGEPLYGKDQKAVNQTIDFMKNNVHNPKPFFLYFGLRIPHPPFYITKDFLEQIDLDEVTIPPEDKQLHPVMAYQRIIKNWQHGFDEDSIRKTRTIYYAMVAQADAFLGQVYDAMKTLGLDDNTYFIFTSDHGENNMEHNLFYKMNHYESSSRVPLIMTGPGIQKNLRIPNIVSLIDIFPTVMDMAELEIPTNLDGESLLPLACGQTKESRNTALAERTGVGGQVPSFMWRKNQWKYIAFPGYEPMLFDLSRDYYEVDNLAASHPDKVKEMDAELRKQIDYPEVTKELMDYNRAAFNEWYKYHSKHPIHLKEYGADIPNAYADDILNNVYLGFNRQYKDKLMYWAKS